jgi:hypothetical protein
LYLEVKKHVTGLVYKDKNPQFITLWLTKPEGITESLPFDEKYVTWRT